MIEMALEYLQSTYNFRQKGVSQYIQGMYKKTMIAMADGLLGLCEDRGSGKNESKKE
jgi:hypothetical protein